MQWDRDRLAALLRRARTEAGVEQQELAARLGVHPSLLSKIETGERSLGVLELRVVCVAFSLPLAEFVGRLESLLADEQA